MKKFCSVLVLILIASLMLAACGNQEKIESELIGTFQYVTQGGSRTISFKGNGTYYEVTEGPLGTIEDSGTYEVQKDKMVLKSDNGYQHTWTYNYNDDNGNLVLYYNDWAYTKTK